MKARWIKTIFELHGMPQLFTRRGTPNDNPFVESAFGTASFSIPLLLHIYPPLHDTQKFANHTPLCTDLVFEMLK
jgi:transposase InsO family protein